MLEEVVAALVVALETVLGEALDDSLEEGDEECDLLAEPSFPDNSGGRLANPLSPSSPNREDMGKAG